MGHDEVGYAALSTEWGSSRVVVLVVVVVVVHDVFWVLL